MLFHSIIRSSLIVVDKTW